MQFLTNVSKAFNTLIGNFIIFTLLEKCCPRLFYSSKKIGPHENNPKWGDDDCEQYFLSWELQNIR